VKITGRLIANLVVVLLLGVLTVGWVITTLIGNTVGERPMSITADFAGSGGVFTNQEVTYRGVLVGKVGEMKLNPDGVDIELLIDPEWKDRIPADLHASVRSKSAVGEQFVNLTPNSSGAPMLTSEDRIERADTTLPIDFQRLLRSLDRVLADVPPETARGAIESLGGGLEGRGEDIGTILRSLATLSDAFASVAPEQQRLLGNATATGTAFLESKESFTAAIKAADKVFEGLGDEPEELRDLFAANDKLARTGIKLLAKHGGDIEKGLEGLGDLVNWQLRTKTDQIASLELLPQFLHAIEDASIPWRSPDGREFYRIRTGLVLDNVPESWPCKYELPVGHETRLPHERSRRRTPTGRPCIPSTVTSTVEVSGLVDALQRWALSYDGASTAAGRGEKAGGNGGVDAPGHSAPEVPGDPSGGFQWPANGLISLGFGDLDHTSEPHRGIDISGRTGDEVVSMGAGLVTFVGFDDRYGHTVVVQHDSEMVSVYAHLDGAEVALGQELGGGARVGTMGCSGVCTDPHLHFEVRRSGDPIDPLRILPPSLLYGLAGGPVAGVGG
jgi:virulence factor Mce-like protein